MDVLFELVKWDLYDDWLLFTSADRPGSTVRQSKSSSLRTVHLQLSSCMVQMASDDRRWMGGFELLYCCDSCSGDRPPGWGLRPDNFADGVHSCPKQFGKFTPPRQHLNQSKLTLSETQSRPCRLWMDVASMKEYLAFFILRFLRSKRVGWLVI